MSRCSLKILSNTDQSNEPEVSELEFEPELCIVSNESHDFLSRHNQVSFRNSDKGSRWRTLAADGGYGEIKITPSWLHRGRLTKGKGQLLKAAINVVVGMEC